MAKAKKKNGYDNIKVVAPPPQYRTGCDLSIEFPIIEQIGIVRALENINLAPVDPIHVVDESLRPTEICRVKDFGDYIMVRAANMKITFDKKSRTIVNISGGGCSDVPYLASEMIGKSHLAGVEYPRRSTDFVRAPPSLSTKRICG